MFSFFSKNEYVIDLLLDSVDIHNHILPGIDDGASTVEESMQLLYKFIDRGITRFVATPHILGDLYPNTPNTITDALQSVRQKLEEENLQHVEIRAAAEYMMDEHFDALISDKDQKLQTLTSTHILVEMSYMQPFLYLEDVLMKIKVRQLKPVLAHPERYAYYHKNPKYYSFLKEQGCALQLNLLSLSPYYGKSVQRIAFMLLENNSIDFVGSDVHHMRHINALKEIKIPSKLASILTAKIDHTKDTFASYE